MSLAEVCATYLSEVSLVVAWSLKCNIWSLIFMNLNFPPKNCEKYISHVQHTIFISAGSPFHTLGAQVVIFNITIYKDFIGLQRSIGQQNRSKITKIYIKKNKKKQPDHKNKFSLLCTS